MGLNYNVPYHSFRKAYMASKNAQAQYKRLQKELKCKPTAH